jgi:hypothetical protein
MRRELTNEEEERKWPLLLIYARRNKIRASWSEKKERQRRGATGKQIPKILLQVVDTSELIALGYLSNGYDPLDL